MTVEKKPTFSKEVRHFIRDMAGGLCSFKGCLVQTSDGRGGQSADAAHIRDAAENGRRGHDGLTDDVIGSAQNGIWLCASHHRLVDATDRTQEPQNQPYSTSQLLLWKAVRERAVWLGVHDPDIRIYLPEVGVRCLDALIWQQADCHDDFSFDPTRQLDVERVKAGCLREYVQRLSSRLSPLASATSPPEANLRPIAALSEQLGCTDSIAELPPASAVTLPPLQVSFHEDVAQTEELVALVRSWLNGAGPVDDRADPVRLSLNLSFGFSEEPPPVWHEVVPFLATGRVELPPGGLPEHDYTFLKTETFAQPVKCKIAITRMREEWRVAAALSRCWDRAPYKFSQLYYQQAFIWDRLLNGVQAGRQLLAFLPAHAGESELGAYPVGIAVSTADLAPGWIENALWTVNRVLLTHDFRTQEGALRGREWEPTPLLFSRGLSDTALQQAAQSLASKLEGGWAGPCDVPVTLLGGKHCFLRSQSWVISLKELPVRTGYRQGIGVRL